MAGYRGQDIVGRIFLVIIKMPFFFKEEPKKRVEEPKVSTSKKNESRAIIWFLLRLIIYAGHEMIRFLFI